MLNDLLSDGITRIRNGLMAGLDHVIVLNSKLVRNVLDVLKSEGYIYKYGISEDQKELKVDLKYSNNRPAIRSIRKISNPSKRIYKQSGKKPKGRIRTSNNFGIFILSTNKGVMPSYKADQLNVGGEILLEVF